MKFLDQYEVNIYGVIVVLFLVFAIGYTVLIVRQQQIISQMASAKEKAKFGPIILADKVVITAQVEPLCSNTAFALDSRQANSADLRTLQASILTNQGKIKLEVERATNNVNADTQFILRGQGYLSKKKSLGDTDSLDFGTLIAGDVTGDGMINQKDLDAMSRSSKPSGSDPKFDLNCDGKVNSTDREIVNSSLGRVAD